MFYCFIIYKIVCVVGVVYGLGRNIVICIGFNCGMNLWNLRVFDNNICLVGMF